MSKKPDNQLDEDDMQCFLDAMSDVRPMEADNRVETYKEKPVVRLQKPEGGEENIPAQNLLSDPADIRDVLTSDELFFARSGIQQKLQKKLKRGELPVEDELDLHGYTVKLAKQAFTDFIEHCQRHGFRCVRVIHGKGQRSGENIPVLKSYVAHWLPQHPAVLAFSSARPHDGGTGAVYVLLKRG